MGGAFAMQTSQLALTRTRNPDVINFANAEIAEQMQVASALGAAPGSAPLRPDYAVLLRQATPSDGWTGCMCKGKSADAANCSRSTPRICEPPAIRRNSRSLRCRYRSSSGI